MRFIFSGLLLFSTLCLSAQTLDEAKEMYKLGEYNRAKPIFEQELFQKPADPSLNQWYGVCLYETGDVVKAEKYISVASQKNIQDAFLYLGNIYAKTYRFDDAEKEFSKYEKLKKRDKAALDKLELSRKEANRIKRIALNTEDIQIIDSLVVSKFDLLQGYKLSPSIGDFQVYNDVFDTHELIASTVFFNGKHSKIYYAKPQGANYSLFSMEKLLDEFANPKRLSNDNFGLSGNLNYPFVMSDGVTVYFSAEDVNGVGGYDLYVTRYNINNDTYLTPERLAAPFNSTFNDYLMVIDEEKGVGWFASDRFQDEGNVCIYTFIPNSKMEIVESEDDSYKVKRAYISSIKDTWRTGKDYNNLINLARKEAEKQVEIKRDFTFVVNDRLTYYTFTEFKSDNAREIYKQALDAIRNFENMKEELKKKRDSYAVASASEKTTLSHSILDMEGQYERLQEQAKELEMKARNQEIQHINQ